MKRVMMLVMVIGMMVMAQTSAMGAFSGTYVDATLSNTDSADPLLADSAWLDGDTAQTSNLWMYRNTAGVDGWVFQSNRSGGQGDSPMLLTTIEGLTAGQNYEIYVAFAKAGTKDCIYAGFAADQLTFFDVTNTPNANIAGKSIFEGYIGTAAAVDGKIKIYIDDYKNPTDGNHRTLYDGLVYNAVPEPATLILLGLGGLATIRRKK